MFRLIFWDKVRGATKDFEGGVGHRGGEPFAESHRIKGIILAPDDGGWGADFAESLGPGRGVALPDGAEVQGEGVTAGGGGEMPQAGIEGEAAAVRIFKAAPHGAVDESGEQGGG